MQATAASSALSSSPAPLDPLAAQLLRDGYAILPNHLAPDSLARLRTELDPHFEAAQFGIGGFYGKETKRFGSVLRRSAEASRLTLDPVIFPLVENILGQWCENILLNLTQAIEIHPGAPVQVPHRDQDMWGGPKGDVQYMINVMWALDDFTAENGATRIWPGSHRLAQDEMLAESAARSAIMPAGSALLFLGSTLHSGGANVSPRPRRGLIISYCLGWLRPWETQWLAYPPNVARNLDPDIAALVGYRQHLPSLGNFEGQCPSVLLAGERHDHYPFRDALRPDQMELMRQYYASLDDQGEFDVAPAGEGVVTNAARC